MRRLPYLFPLWSEAFLGTGPVMPAWLFQALTVWHGLMALVRALFSPVKPAPGAGHCPPMKPNAGGLRRHDRMPAPLA